MSERFWVHEPIKGLQEIYNSNEWFDVSIGWFFAKAIGVIILVGGILGFFWIMSFFA